MTMSARCSAVAVAAAAARAVLGLRVLQAFPTRGVAQGRPATMSNATLFCGTT